MKRRVRLPFLIALLAALALLVWMRLPFSPPNRVTREAAVAVQTAPASLRPFLADQLYPALEKPRPGSWLDTQREWAQDVEDFRSGGFNMPDGTRKVIYLLPLGEFSSQGRMLDVFREYIEIFFQIEAKLAPAVAESAPKAKSRRNEETGHRQLLTVDILSWLSGQEFPNEDNWTLRIALR